MQDQLCATLEDGIAAVRAGDAERGRDLLRRAAAESPTDDTPWVWLSTVAADTAEAVAHLRTALQLNPHNQYAVESLGKLLLAAGVDAARRNSRAEARPLLAEVLRLDPRNETALIWLAGIADTPEEGAAQLRAVLAVNPNNARAKQGLAHFEAQIAPKWQCPLCDTPARGEPPAVCPHCRAVLSLGNPVLFTKPTGADIKLLKAAAGRLYEAVKTAKDPRTAYLLGLCYLNLGYKNEGLQTLQSAARHRDADPNWRSAVAALAQQLAGPAAPGPGANRAPRPTVLVVDDSLTIQKLVSTTLAAAGYEVLTASGAEPAVALIRQGVTPKLFILDINMPGMDGFELCKVFRQTPETAKVPVVFLTGKDGLLSKLRGQWVGASDYLVKPFDPQKLLSTVQKLAPTETARA